MFMLICGRVVNDDKHATKEEMEANAKLIASAPEMLELLLSMRVILNGFKKLDKDTIGYKIQEKAFKIINKAL